MITAGHSKLFRVLSHSDSAPDGTPLKTNTFSKMDAMCIVDDDLYCIKTDTSQVSQSGKHKVALYKFSNFVSFDSSVSLPSVCFITTSAGSQYIAEHANSITCRDKINRIFMMATRNNPNNSNAQVVEFGEDGVITSKISANSKIDRIDYYGKISNKNRYIICQGNVGTSQINYSYKRVHIDNLHFVKDYGFSVMGTNSSYTDGNDDFYDRTTHKLYTTKFIKLYDQPRPEGGYDDTIRQNRICEYDLSSVSEGDNVYGTDIIQSDYSFTDGYNEWMYEIEGLGLYGGSVYVCTNTKVIMNNTLKDYDCVYSLVVSNEL